MTLKIIEGLLVGLLVIITWVIWRRSFTRNLLAIVYRLLKLLLTYGAGLLAFKYAASQGYGMILSGLAAMVVGFVTMFVLGFILRPGKGDGEHRSLLNGLFQRLGNTFLILLLWAVCAVAVDLTATIIEQSRYREQVKSQSWLLSRFMDWHESTAAEMDMHTSNPLLDKLGKSRDWLYDKAGFDRLLGQVDAISQIQQLAPQQRNALMNQDENLKKLLQNPDMLKVINSSEIQKLIKQSGQGDAAALMQLSKHPDINKLLSDPAMYKQIMSLNPSKLMAEHKSLSGTDAK